MYFLFSVGVKMDSRMMVRPERKAITIGCSVMFTTLAFTTPVSLLLRKYLPMDDSLAKALPMIASSQFLTPFANIACLLAELKILNTDIGRLAISSSMFCDIVGISITVVGLSIQETRDGQIITCIWAILSTFAVLLGIVFVSRPALKWILRRTPEGKPVGETHIHFILAAVLVASLLSEVIGQHFVFGAIVFGLSVPDGPPLGATLSLKIDSLASGLLYPTFLTVSGLKTNVFKVHLRSFCILGLVVLCTTLVKITAVIVPAYFLNIPIREGFVLGLILNARGICELILYNLWMDGEVMLTDQEFTLAVISVIGVTSVISPLIAALYNPSKQHLPIKRTTIQHAKHDTELRILIGIHNQDNIPSLINLLEASNATEESHIAVIAVLLVPLVGRSTPVLIEHQPEQNLEHSMARSNHIINALRHFELYNEGFVTIKSFTSLTYHHIMYDDICRVARDQNATIVILPFHKQWAIDGSIASANRHTRAMNHKIMDIAPFSVGILIDRGVLNSSMSILNTQSEYHVAVIYISGADDAEALSYAARMVTHGNITLTIIRFLLFGCDNARERKLDNDLIEEVRHVNIGNEGFFYEEEVVRNGVGLASSIRQLENCYDLIMVGRNHQESPLLIGLDAWSECPELGVVGDLLASPDLETTASILVVQQQRIGGNLVGRTANPDIHDKNPLNSTQYQSTANTSAGENITWTISMNRV
ncbi:cation/H(+) antiporter 15-like [Cornus florida]|uniref:cation/H(+) antiporter 15-like n=1 Tax=Cornus florida TaxID=4283 RepID=UPI0028A2B65D|nr:cation/H(+) antiporter 15-like [Cornus florida]